MLACIVQVVHIPVCLVFPSVANVPQGLIPQQLGLHYLNNAEYVWLVSTRRQKHQLHVQHASQDPMLQLMDPQCACIAHLEVMQ